MLELALLVEQGEAGDVSFEVQASEKPAGNGEEGAVEPESAAPTAVLRAKAPEDKDILVGGRAY